MPTIITGHVYLDAAATRALPTPVGPFAGSTEARAFMDALGPLWGSWGIENLGSTDLADYGFARFQHHDDRRAVMSKIDEILDAVDAGGDRDVKWSARHGNRVFLHYEDGTQVVVEARAGRLEVVPSPPDSGSDQ